MNIDYKIYESQLKNTDPQKHRIWIKYMTDLQNSFVRMYANTYNINSKVFNIDFYDPPGFETYEQVVITYPNMKNEELVNFFSAYYDVTFRDIKISAYSEYKDEALNEPRFDINMFHTKVYKFLKNEFEKGNVSVSDLYEKTNQIFTHPER